MPNRTLQLSSAGTRRDRLRIGVRWMVSFVGFPLGGFAALLVIGRVESLWSALAGGLITGLFVGAAQVWGVRERWSSRFAVRWIAATAIGLMVGLGVGSRVVDYGTSLAALVVQGAICGLFVGAGQALVLGERIPRLAPAWPVALGAIWAIGWVVTTLSGIQVDQQFTVFGSFGAITVTALTAVLPFILHRNGARAS
jgi:hypothetical protein